MQIVILPLLRISAALTLRFTRVWKRINLLRLWIISRNLGRRDFGINYQQVTLVEERLGDIKATMSTSRSGCARMLESYHKRYADGLTASMEF